MAGKIEAGQNISTPVEAELTPLEKAREHIVDWLENDPTIEPFESLYIQVINQKIAFYNDRYVNPGNIKELFAEQLKDTNIIPANKELAQINFDFHAVSNHYRNELIRTFPLPSYYLDRIGNFIFRLPERTIV